MQRELRASSTAETRCSGERIVGTMIASRTEEAVPGELAVVFCAPSGILGNWSRPAYDSTWKGLGGPPPESASWDSVPPAAPAVTSALPSRLTIRIGECRDLIDWAARPLRAPPRRQ